MAVLDDAPDAGTPARTAGPASAPPPVRTVPVRAEFTADHPVALVRGLAGGHLLASEDGPITVTDRDLRVLRTLDLGTRPEDLDVPPGGGPLAWIADGWLWTGTGEEPRALSEVHGPAACRWFPDGRRIWLARVREGRAVVEVRTADGELIAAAGLAGDAASVRLTAHPDPAAVVCRPAAGSPERGRSHLVRLANTVLTDEILWGDGLPPRFSPDGSRFATADRHGLTVVTAHDGGAAEERRLPWDAVDPRHRDAPGTSLRLLPYDRLAWASRSGRIRILTADPPAVRQEIALAGHPVRTAAEIYPQLAGDDTPATDLRFFTAGHGPDIVSVHGTATVAVSAAGEWAGRW